MKTAFLAIVTALAFCGSAMALSGLNGTALNLAGLNGTALNLAGVNGTALNATTTVNLNSLHVLRVTRH